MKQLPQETIFQIIYDNAMSQKTPTNNRYEIGCIGHFFDDYPYADFEYLQKQAFANGFKIKPAKDIQTSDKYLLAEQAKNSLLIFWVDENIL